MGIKQIGNHTIYTDGDCAPGFVLVGDAMIPEATYKRMCGKITLEEEKRQLAELDSPNEVM